MCEGHTPTTRRPHFRNNYLLTNKQNLWCNHWLLIFSVGLPRFLGMAFSVPMFQRVLREAQYAWCLGDVSVYSMRNICGCRGKSFVYKASTYHNTYTTNQCSACVHNSLQDALSLNTVIRHHRRIISQICQFMARSPLSQGRGLV